MHRRRPGVMRVGGLEGEGRRLRLAGGGVHTRGQNAHSPCTLTDRTRTRKCTHRTEVRHTKDGKSAQAAGKGKRGPGPRDAVGPDVDEQAVRVLGQVSELEDHPLVLERHLEGPSLVWVVPLAQSAPDVLLEARMERQMMGLKASAEGRVG